MTPTPTALTTVPEVEDPRELALLKAVGLDKLQPEQRELALNIAARYELDLMLKHLVMIEGRPYITRDGLLHIAHRSGQLDGLETTEPVLGEDHYWRSTCSVYRKDMSHPFTYIGRYPEAGQNRKFAPEMAVKVGEVMSLRRAFDVAAPAAEERWDVDGAVDHEPPPKPPTLAERVAEKAAEVVEVEGADGVTHRVWKPEAEPVDVAAEAQRIFAEDEVPVGALSVDDIKAKAKEAHILPAVLATYIESLFGERIQLANLTDEQRFALWEAVKP
jgi:hypothetical protein